MARVKLLNIHRTWEDVLGMVLGLLTVLSPVLALDAIGPGALTNAGAVGVLVLMFAALELIDLRRWEEGIEALLGLWLMASPFVFGYADGGLLMIAHLILGASVAALAVVELWQDWAASDQELAKHGH